MTANIERLCPPGPKSTCSQTPDSAGTRHCYWLCSAGCLEAACEVHPGVPVDGDCNPPEAEGIARLAPIKDGARPVSMVAGGMGVVRLRKTASTEVMAPRSGNSKRRA